MDRINLTVVVVHSGIPRLQTSMEAPNVAEVWNILAGVLLMGGVSPEKLQGMFDGGLRVYDRKKRTFIDPQATIGDAGIEDGTILIATDLDDEAQLIAGTVM